jgi:predicted AAA+ superfamily ATPase
MPLKANAKMNEFKVFFSDIGLLMAMYGEESRISLQKDGLGIYKGAIYENLIADILYKNGISNYYYTWYKETKKYEIDFIFSISTLFYGLEIKSGRSNHSSSFKLLNNKNIKKIKLVLGNVSLTNDGLILPIHSLFYLLSNLKNNEKFALTLQQ